MQIKIEGVNVMFRAIESFRYEEGNLVVRTVSGKEYKKSVDSKEKADILIDKIINNMVICESA